MSGAIRLCYKLKLKRAWRAPYRLSWLVISPQAATEKPRSLSGWWNSCNSAVFAWGCIAGYGGKAESYPLLLSADTTTAQAGDEPVLIYQRTGAPVAVSPVRSDAVKAILAQHPDVQIIVTDDGLQHYRLARDVEIVVIDGVRRFGNGWWLPAGPMRERAGRLKSVDAVIVNGGVPAAVKSPCICCRVRR